MKYDIQIERWRKEVATITVETTQPYSEFAIMQQVRTMPIEDHLWRLADETTAWHVVSVTENCAQYVQLQEK